MGDCHTPRGVFGVGHNPGCSVCPNGAGNLLRRTDSEQMDICCRPGTLSAMKNKAEPGESTCGGAGSGREAGGISLRSFLHHHPNGSGQVEEFFFLSRI